MSHSRIVPSVLPLASTTRPSDNDNVASAFTPPSWPTRDPPTAVLDSGQQAARHRRRPRAGHPARNGARNDGSKCRSSESAADGDGSTCGFAEFSSRWRRFFSSLWRILQPHGCTELGSAQGLLMPTRSPPDQRPSVDGGRGPGGAVTR
jgi:hypothetical protein